MDRGADYQGGKRTGASVRSPHSTKLGTINLLRDNEYEMDGNTVWIEIGNIALNIRKMGDHVMFQACQKGKEFDCTLDSMAVKQPRI